MPQFLSSACLVTGLTFVCLPLFAAESPSHFPSNEDLRHFKAMSEPRLSPDGRQVLVSITDSTADGAKSHLWLVDVEKNTSRQLTYSPESDRRGEHDGEWMPDGESILFLAHRGEHTELFRLPMNGGEAKAFALKVAPAADRSKLPDALPPAKGKSDKSEEKAEPLSIDVNAFVIAPDGKAIAILARDPQTPGEKKQRDAKADATWVDHEIHRTRLYLLDPASSKLDPVTLEEDVHRAAWSHDNTHMVVLTETPNGAGDLGPANSTWLVTVKDTTHPEKLAALPSTISGAVWSADDQSILYFAQTQKDAPPGYRDLYLYNLTSKASRSLSDGFSGMVSHQDPIVLPDGSILQSVAMGVETTIAVSTSSHPSLEVLRFPMPVTDSLDTNRKQTGWVFLGRSSTQPTTLYYTADLKTEPRVLNTPVLGPENLRSVASKRIHWTNEKLAIEGLLYLPPEAAEHRVPLIVDVHGGPFGAYLDTYDPFIDFFLGHGWAILRMNPRGSSNYSVGFAAANKNDLGGGDYRDIMAGVDFVLKTESIDPDRLALMGYSYGGEMAGFVEGKTSRFKAIVSGAPVIDQNSEYGTESSSWYDRWYFGKPWEHPLDAWRQSPLSHVGHATTPFLLLQGEGDTTDPLGQSQEMYRALRQTGVPVELVTYPRDNHGPLAQAIYGRPTAEPWHGFDARQRIVAFFEKAFASPGK